MPAKDRGFIGDQHTLFDLDDYVIPNCENTRVAVQAGSGIGMWPSYLSKTFGSVYTFEPNPELFYCVCRNAPQGNIYRYQAALGNDRSTVDMSWGFSRNNYGGYYVVPGGDIPTLRIDDLALPHCDLIMLDIEGRELEALKGAEETIRKHRPAIVFESKSSALRRFDASIQDVQLFIKQFRYRQKDTFHQGKDEIWVPKQS